MTINRVDWRANPTAALTVLDANCVDLDQRLNDVTTTANAAKTAASAALAKLNPTGTGLLKTEAVTPIANSSGDTRLVFDMGVSNGTDDRIQLLCTRVTANNDWQGTIWRLRRIVNGFQQGMIEFGQGQIATGGAVTINGAVPWTTANTTVDGNNFIKRI